MHSERQKHIADAIIAEFDRQSVELREEMVTSHKRYAVDGILDLDALAIAIDSALHGGPTPGNVPKEGPTPEELNSSNDG